MCERLWKCKHFVIEEFVVFDESGEPCDEALEYYCNKRDDYKALTWSNHNQTFQEREHC